MPKDKTKKVSAPAREYCRLCGNHKTVKTDICPECRAVIRGPLARAYARYVELGKQHRQCCGGLACKKDHLYFHGKYFSASYPEKAKEGESQVCVEMGVNFYAGHARTYWIFDTENSSDSFEYGDPISYDDPGFSVLLDNQLDQAAKAAWDDDVLSCSECGSNYSAQLGGCGCQEEEEEEKVSGLA